MAPVNLHAGVVVISGVGVAIEGVSGSGKTSLALELIAQARALGAFACLVADDQCLISAHSGRLVARAPGEIAGLVELRGYGPARIEHVPAAVVDLHVELVEEAQAPRVESGWTRQLAGVELASLRLKRNDDAVSARAVLGWLAARG